MSSYSVYLGRFQPIHNGHTNIIKKALEHTDELILILGSHNEAPNTRNPFNSKERADMITLALEYHQIPLERVHLSTVENHLYNNNRWVASVNDTVNGIIWRKWQADKTPIFFIGPKKSSDPDLKVLFPNWGKIDVPEILEINATDIRKQIFEDEFIFCNEFVLDNVCPPVSQYISSWAATKAGVELTDEHHIIKDYKDSWAQKPERILYDADGKEVIVKEGPPYPVIFQTVDAVVTQSGHVLMVTRGAAPGKGLLALPGGFVNPNETLQEAAIRELREETKIDVPDKVLVGSIVWNRSFDDPHRSARGRTITQAYHIDLEPRNSLPKVRGSDDAIHAQWIPINQLDKTKIFEDHYAIISIMTGI